MFLKYQCLYRKIRSLWRLGSVLYIELVLSVILIFKINIKSFGPKKAHLGFVEHTFTAWGAEVCVAGTKTEQVERPGAWGTFLCRLFLIS